MDRLGKELLARAGFPGYQYCFRRRRDGFDESENSVDSMIAAYDRTKYLRMADLVGQ